MRTSLAKMAPGVLRTAGAVVRGLADVNGAHGPSPRATQSSHPLHFLVADALERGADRLQSQVGVRAPQHPQAPHRARSVGRALVKGAGTALRVLDSAARQHPQTPGSRGRR